MSSSPPNLFYPGEIRAVRDPQAQRALDLIVARLNSVANDARAVQTVVSQLQLSIDAVVTREVQRVFETREVIGINLYTDSPLSGGGPLNTDRTIAIDDFQASGASHDRGAVPDPGVTAGTTKFLREDASWQEPAVLSGLNGALVTLGYVHELLTINTGGTTTDTAANLLPANSVILAVVSRVTTAISGGGVTSIHVGDATTANRFADTRAITLGSTDAGTRQMDTSLNAATVGPRQVAAAKVRVTANGGTPTQGVIRLVSFFWTLTPPTS